MKVVTRSGIPLNKISDFRPILEENALCCTDFRHMSDIVSLVLTQELKKKSVGSQYQYSLMGQVGSGRH